MRVADYLMSRLADAGIDHVFVLPGGGAMHLNDGLACEPRMRAVPCHHEQACGIAAEAWGRIAGKFGVAMVTTGPGATNVITPVTGAWIESVPLLVISGQVKRADLLRDRPLRQGGVQEVNIIPMVRSITKYAATLDEPRLVRFHLEQALHQMLTGRPGPVWLDVPLDVQAAEVDPEELPGFIPEAMEGTVPPDSLNQVIQLLQNASRPLLLAGHGVRLSGAASAFLSLAEKLGVPVATTWNAADLIPWDHPLHAGRPGVVALRSANFAVQNCDLLIAVGCRLDNVLTAYNPRGYARGARKVVVDVDQNEISKLDMDIAVPIVADAAAFVEGLGKRVSGVALPDYLAWRTRCHQWKQRYAIENEGNFAASGSIGHFQFAATLANAVPANTTISTGSSGLGVEAFYTVFRNKPGQRIFLTSGLGAMGYGLPAAIGACLATARRPTIAVESDGSLQLNLQELATLRGLNLPICILVMNNRGYCSIRNTQRNYFNGRYLGTDPESGLWFPDLAKVAATYEFPYLSIDDAADLDQGLRQALDLPRPCLIDVRLLANESLSPKAAALPQPDGSMLSMPLEDMSPLLSLEQLREEMLVPLLPQSLRAQR